MHAHTDVVTAIATPLDNSDMILTASRDKSIIIWDLTKVDETYDVPRHSLIGHSHFVQDVALSSNNQFAVSCSRDRELRLWDLDSGTTICRFVGHTKDVLSVDISKDNCQIVSGSRDGTIKLWNTFGECIYTFNDAHADWISCVLFSPNEFSPSDIQPYIVSASWDKTVKVWHQNDYDGNGDGKLIKTLAGHSGYVNTVAVSPDYSLWASGGKDGVILFRNVPDEKIVYSFYVGSIIHALCFFPNRYLLCAATESSIMILELVNKTIVEGLKIDLKTETDNSNSTEKAIYCTSLNWSADGSSLLRV